MAYLPFSHIFVAPFGWNGPRTPFDCKVTAVKEDCSKQRTGDKPVLCEIISPRHQNTGTSIYLAPFGGG